MYKLHRSGHIVFPILVAAVICVLGFVFTPLAMSESKTQIETPGPASESERVKILGTLEKAFASASIKVNDLKTQLEQFDLVQKAILTETGAYEMQNSAHGSILLLSTTTPREIERAFGENQTVLKAIGDKIKIFEKEKGVIDQLIQQNREQIALARKQQAEIGTEGWPQAEKQALLLTLDRLLKLFEEKQIVLNTLHDGYTFLGNRLESVRVSTALTTEKLAEQLRSRSKQQLFHREFLLIKVLDWQYITFDLENTMSILGRFFDAAFWEDEIVKVKKAGIMPLITLILLILVGAFISFKLRGICVKFESHLSGITHPWLALCLMLIRRSVLLFGAIIVLYLYETIQFPHYRVPAIRLFLNLLFILALSRWGFDFLAHWQPGDEQPAMTQASPLVRSLLIYLRVLAIVYILFVFLAGQGSLILFPLRLILEISLIAWCYGFWKIVLRAKRQTDGDPEAELTPFQSVTMGVCYLVSVGGLIIEFAGYPSLSSYWYVSWAKTIAVIFWGMLLFLVIREWQQQYKVSLQTPYPDHTKPGRPFHLLFVQVAWIAWILCLLDGLLLAWSTNLGVFQAVYGFMGRPWSIGSINLSVMGLIWAFLILFFTYTLTRLGRYVLSEKLLADATMETGLKSSIITITLYLMWGLGLILALGVLGVSTTSLAVVFGAMSIGIGFGLQNIFNNFISGIILLFERPIQVGDAVEVGGIWGEVKKINVRATVVQTYDNAAMIIPNSEFISRQVTNWSFKDQRLRCKVKIGVAYGSDVERVRRTLLEIADSHGNILKFPKPDVVFVDHADSALLFTLRYWTTLDYMVTSATGVRFEIDRLFKEYGIEIAFPQRDIHIRSIVKDGKTVVDPADIDNGGDGDG